MTDPCLTHESAPQDDVRSTFFYHGIELPYSFSLTELTVVVNAHFSQTCLLRKLGKGAYHEVYEVFAAGDEHGGLGQSLDAVIRVACPVFPGDKMRSEIATLAYIAAHTSVPVPAVYAWNTDVSNPVGAEWMIMQKIPGIVPTYPWLYDLPIDVKLNVVRQVARHLRELFSLRFAKAGSIYFASDAYSRSSNMSVESSSCEFKIGPVVSTAFHRLSEGKPDYPSTDLHSPGSSSFTALHALRGPFAHAGEFMAHRTRAYLFKCELFPQEALQMASNDLETDLNDEQQDAQAEDSSTDTDQESDGSSLSESTDSDQENGLPESPQEALERAKTMMKTAIKVCDIYPGDTPVWHGDISTPDRPFTLHWYDFRLGNILIDEKTGTVNGYIDFEGAVTAPLWLAAEVVGWVPDPVSDRTNSWGGTRADQFRLWRTFHSTMNACDADGEWRKAYEGGRYFREWANYLLQDWNEWSRNTVSEAVVNENLAWASKEGNRGMGRPNIDEASGKDWDEAMREYVLKQYGPDPTEEMDAW